ncbi:MAG: UbiD family decarboxylase [Saprospiraceae bacterium]|nr:UbiD family decarboxylase [Saprospiraceae bacterium]MCF8248596.1 UbiD family decarboxylase [Saprospiraceae bacterium]MCF8281034.1 UbiD family decarboxylase [Bacteroidales bacterium]MCF8310329.1 UbiD family decarboxylase [Saprospiraceae bacterium]MCF8442090.1 UbiD family decarboxylase [Saprospiraceae bacterium]
MSYKSLRECVNDLEKHGHLLRIKFETDPNLEMAEIHRRVYDAQGPAILFEKVKGSPFQAVSNLYGTTERTAFIFRKTLDKVRRVMELKADPMRALKQPMRYLGAPFTALTALPKIPIAIGRSAPVMFGKTTIDQLPQIKSWPMDGGAFITLPQVLTLPPNDTNIMHTNIGMYRIQLSGNEYITNKEIGLHYQLHRGIGIHHTQYNQSDEPFRCAIFVGGPPSHAFAAIMPMPEGLSELTFAGLLGGRRFRYKWANGHVISADADFVITGTIRKDLKKPEGPFGDHLGYYSLTHDFPVMEVENVYHRKDAIWHFTVVGRPPQEDSSFGWLIHQIVEPLTAGEFPGIREVHAVDASGVHPLLLAIGSERYMPFREPKPEEILTQANHLLGKGQTTLAKFLIIANGDDDPKLDTHDIPHFFQHVLERIDLGRDLHFQTKTTIDTLDYSGSGWNEGSKLVIACCGAKRRELRSELPPDFILPTGFSNPVFVQAGILAVQSPKFEADSGETDIQLFTKEMACFGDYFEQHIPLILLVDDAKFTAATLNNFLWVAFTRANPSHDVHGIDSFVEKKHWGCRGGLALDARKKPHHAPELVPDEVVTKRVDEIMKDLKW